MIAITPGADFRKVVALEELLALEALEVEADQMEVEPDSKKFKNHHVALQGFLVTGLGGAGTMAGGGGLATALPPLGSDSLKLNCRKNSLVSLRCEKKCGKTVKMKKQLTCSSGTRIAAQTCPPRVKGPSRIWLICVKTGFHCSVSHRVLIIVMTP